MLWDTIKCKRLFSHLDVMMLTDMRPCMRFGKRYEICFSLKKRLMALPGLARSREGVSH